MYVSSWPGIRLRELAGRRSIQPLPYPFTNPQRLSFCVARSGIYHLFRALRLKPHEVVLVPDYHSGNEVAAIRAAGASIVYYPIRRNLEPDMDTLRRLARQGARVIYTIHYLGWPQPLNDLRALCREHGSLLVEDCALSLLSQHRGDPLGSFGDFSIFCLYKTLPLPNGGVLAQNRAVLPALERLQLEACPKWSGAGRSAELLLEAFRSRSNLAGGLLFAIKRLAGRGMRALHVRHVPVGNIGWNLADVHLAMSPISDHMAHRLDYPAIVRRRRENFEHLRRVLDGRVRMLREDLPECVCPLFFPILVKDKRAAARALRKRGIGAVEFWNDCDPQSRPNCGPDSLYLRAHVLELPIHQDVSSSQIEYIAAQVRQLEVEPA